MGANLSSTVIPDTSKDIISPQDMFADVTLGIVWAGSLYACAAIFCTLALIDRWRGEDDKVAVGTASVIGAVLLSTVWPLVALVLLFNR